METNRREFIRNTLRVGGFMALVGMGLPISKILASQLDFDSIIARKRIPHGSGECDTLVQGYDNAATITQAFGDAARYRAAGSFVASKTFTCCTIMVRLSKVGAPNGNITCVAYSDSSNLPNTALSTGTGTYTQSNIGTTSSFLIFTFNQVFTSGTQYHTGVLCDTLNDASNYFRLHYLDTGSQYISRYSSGAWAETDATATPRILLYE